MDCKLIDCEDEATVRVVHPFGTVNVCEPHAIAIDAYDPDTGRALLQVMRYGPKDDPPLEDEDRGPAFPKGDYPKFQRRGPILDVLAAYDGERASCECPHGKRWPEGDRFEGDGGRACRECCDQAYALRGA